MNLKSLAVPAISCGDFGFPKKLCAKIMFEAVRQHQMGYDEQNL